MNELEKILDKRKLKLEDLDDEEKETYDRWKKTLIKEVTLDTLNAFCQHQKEEIEKIYTDRDNSRDKDFILKATLSVYISILGLINGTKAERVALVDYLEKLIKEK